MTEAPPPSDETTTMDAATDTKERFAADLRKLRLDGGNPTLKRLQDETGISRSVLSEAFAGRTLPTARTVDGVVRVCGGDVAVWLDRRDVLAGLATPPSAPAAALQSAPPAQTTDAAPAASASAPASVPATPQVTGIRRRTAVLIAAVAFLFGAVASGATASVVTAQVYATDLAAAQQAADAADAQPADDTEVDDAATPQIEVATGEDPAFTPCVDDAKVATADSRIDDTLIEIIWSNKCYAGWARITRYDAKYEGNTVTIAIYPETAPNGPDRQEATEHDVQGAYTTLVVRPSPDTLLCAEGRFTVDGESFDLGDPICI